MKIVFSFIAGNGHLQPLVPVARACVDAGHDVQFVCHVDMQARVETAGFTAVGYGEASNAPPERRPLEVATPAQEEAKLRDKFALSAGKTKSAAVLPIFKELAPDVIVCDETDFGTMIAAEILNIPHATVIVIASGMFVRPEVVGEALNEVRAEYGLPPDPQMHMLGRHLIITPVPEGFRDPSQLLPITVHRIKPLVGDVRVACPVPTHFDDAPTIYFTLGTVFNSESGDLFTRVLAGLHDVHANVIVTVGRHIDPAELGEQPPHTHVAQYIPQDQLLPHCDLMINHAGSGSVIAALAHGVPMVVIPMGADQPHNAIRCEALGMAEVLHAVHLTPDDVTEAVNRVLNTPTYREAAEHFRDLAAQAADVASVVTVLQALVSAPH